MKKLFFLMFVCLSFAFAEDLTMIKAYSILGAVIGLGIAAFGGALGMGYVTAATVSGIARNPGVGGKLTGTMFIAVAMIEAQVIYTFVLALIVFYNNPFIA